MIVLDTNVLSEILKGPGESRAVRTWRNQLTEQPVTTVLNRAELLAGAAVLPAGRRRDILIVGVQRLTADLSTCLPLGDDAASSYAEIVARRRHLGRPIGTMDALIAAVATVHGAGIATRDVSGFDGLGLQLINPFE